MPNPKHQTAKPDKPQSSLFRDDLARILDAVNAWGFLEDVKEAKPRQINCFGPKDFRGFVPRPWVGVLLWSKYRNYYAYKTLHLLGIWACKDDEAAQIVVGTKSLPYKLPFFDVESYHYNIQKRFDLHYQGDAAPPPESSRRYTAIYAPEQRLFIRGEIQSTLLAWTAEFN